MNSPTPPGAGLSRRVFLAAAAAVSVAGYLRLPSTPAAAAVATDLAADPAPRPHNTLLGVL
ncbi:hypothetical protein [Kribbella jiaozuonensis]|uniref:Twin-arginine translocation signal domain-containing protein n=1 Tax=Kribbella jiaozuonensis TaxID=2575441 RepID=A0A4U3LUQ0_9ACTN|nr:hypothetical protein [Kribbella jiaozuonensis]TKK79522.1 hypothetical protein FDA38_14055 [Kribbella jiaozuonensis]